MTPSRFVALERMTAERLTRVRRPSSIDPGTDEPRAGRGFGPRQPGPDCRISNWRRIVSGYRSGGRAWDLTRGTDVWSGGIAAFRDSGPALSVNPNGGMKGPLLCLHVHTCDKGAKEALWPWTASKDRAAYEVIIFPVPCPPSRQHSQRERRTPCPSASDICCRR